MILESDFNGVRWTDFDPVQVLKSCDCYAYQTCEHNEWTESEAFAFIDALRSRAWHALKGYEDAEWGYPPTIDKRRTISLER